MSRWSIPALVLIIASGSHGCRKPRDWSLNPTAPTSMTMEVGGHPGLYVRVDIVLPERYERERGGPSDNITWRTPEKQKSEGHSPRISLSLDGGKPYPDGCSAPGNNDAAHVLVARQLRKDLLVTQCGYTSKASPTNEIEAVSAYLSVQLPTVANQWYLWCRINFDHEYEARDIGDATAICSSIQWHTLEPASNQTPDPEPSTGGSGK